MPRLMRQYGLLDLQLGERHLELHQVARVRERPDGLALWPLSQRPRDRAQELEVAGVRRDADIAQSSLDPF
eukprot:2298671-Pyramimonas_sp.AAC.1